MERKGETIRIRAAHSDLPSLLAFEPIAKEMLKRAGVEGYEIVEVHESSRYPGNLYDSIVIRRINAEEELG